MSADQYRFVVVVPCRDEAHHIASCLESVMRSVASAGIDPHRFEVVVVADSCRDDTAAVARRLLRSSGHVIEIRAGSAGRARAVGTAYGLDRWGSVGADRIWTVHTDADTVVPGEWLRRHAHVANAGLAAVAGVVEVDSFDGYHPGLAAVHGAAYGGPGDDHPHVHGANLGVRADAYLAVGGWAAIPSGEDHALWRAVRQAGYPTLATRSIRVVTSGRRHGRAPAGFAGYLCDLEAAM